MARAEDLGGGGEAAGEVAGEVLSEVGAVDGGGHDDDAEAGVPPEDLLEARRHNVDLRRPEGAEGGGEWGGV